MTSRPPNGPGSSLPLLAPLDWHITEQATAAGTGATYRGRWRHLSYPAAADSAVAGASSSMRAHPLSFTCRLCGQPHRPIRLARSRRALCTRCGCTLARRSVLGPPGAAAFAFAGGILLFPAVVLPFATVSRLGPAVTTTLLDGAGALWDHRMPLLSAWVALCAVLAPALLLVGLLGLHGASARGDGSMASRWSRLVHLMEAWAMPEVYVLAVLVALIRIHVLADVSVEAGFWCYTAASLCLVTAWRSYELEPRRQEELLV